MPTSEPTIQTLITDNPTQAAVSNPVVPKPPTGEAPIDAEKLVVATVDGLALKIEAMPLPLPQVVFETAALLVVPSDVTDVKPAISSKRRAVDHEPEKVGLPQNHTRTVSVVPVVSDTAKSVTRVSIDNAESVVVALADTRAAPLLQPIDKPASTTPDRVATFAPLIADAVRDLVHLAQDKDVRFHVRPEALGLVAVTIERDAAGPTLRLAVETQLAAQAVRQAEPMMNDARGNAPFVQVTVDLNASDQRGRHARAPINAKRQSDDAPTPIEHRTTLAASGQCHYGPQRIGAVFPGRASDL